MEKVLFLTAGYSWPHPQVGTCRTFLYSWVLAWCQTFPAGSKSYQVTVLDRLMHRGCKAKRTISGFFPGGWSASLGLQHSRSRPRDQGWEWRVVAMAQRMQAEIPEMILVARCRTTPPRIRVLPIKTQLLGWRASASCSRADFGIRTHRNTQSLQAGQASRESSPSWLQL